MISLVNSSTTTAPSAHIEEIAKAHILKVVVSAPSQDKDELDKEPLDIFEVYAVERRWREAKAAKIPKLTTPPARTSTPPASSLQKATNMNRPTPQYQYQASIEDQQLTTQLMDWLLGGKLTQMTLAHILAVTVPRDHVSK
jgi:hypothetical protein